ncbi:hypothetical protein [Sphingomonas sp. M1A8_2b]
MTAPTPPTPTPPAPTPTPPLAPEPVDDDGHDTPDAARARDHDPRAFTPEQPARYTQRLDGWTPERQRGFLERIAEGATVDEASASVGLTPGVAYRLRRRAAGGAFALGWDAAKLVARPIVAEALFHRAIAGQIERVTRPDGAVIERHRYDNRLAMALLNRLDRHAADSETSNAAARLVAADFDAFLDLVGHDAGPARAGLFLGGLLLGERIPADGAPSDSAHPDREAEAAMAPILALARADLWLRTGSTRAADIATADLDPAARAGWTAEQWSRAEAAGLLRLAPEPVPEPTPEPVPQKAAADIAPASALPALHAASDTAPAVRDPVWFDEDADCWRTAFPPPLDFDGEDGAHFGDDDYSRDCSLDEAIILDTPRRREVAARAAAEGADRDAWFLGYAIDVGLIDAAGVETIADTDADRVTGVAWACDAQRSEMPDTPSEPSAFAWWRAAEIPGAEIPDTEIPDEPPVAKRPVAEPKPPTGRSIAVTLPDDGDPP